MRKEAAGSKGVKIGGGVPMVRQYLPHTHSISSHLHATWLKMTGADLKDAQAQMRHSRSSTTLHTYQQFVPESQPRAVDRLSRLVN
jgi:hypothetical protein